MKIVFIKLGGSLITDKAQAYTTRPDVIKRIVSEIKAFRAEHPNVRLIVGNGAGSFAHRSAHKYDTVNGFDDEHGKYGYCVVQNDAARLNRIVVSEFLEQRMPAIGLQPSALFLSASKAHHSLHTNTLLEALEKNIIPVMHGDAILDQEIGATIFSTDKIFKILIENFAADKTLDIQSMVSVGNYDGVLDVEKKVVPQITRSNFDQIRKDIEGSGEIDITGGMIVKVEDLLEIAARGVPSYIISGMLKDNLQNCLCGKDFLGTKIS